MPRRKRPVTRGQSKHPGVVIRKRTHASGRTTYQARWTDPRTGRTVEQSLSNGRKLKLTTKDARADWAIGKSKELQRLRREVEAGRVARETPDSISKAIEAYLEEKELEQARPGTIASYRPSLLLFSDWAAELGLPTLEQLRVSWLSEYRSYLLSLKKLLPVRGGQRGEKGPVEVHRSPATANRDLRHLKAFLSWARRRGFLPHVEPEDIKDQLKRIPEDQVRPRFLRPPQIRQLLEACLRHDAQTYEVTREEHSGVRPRGSTLRYRQLSPLVLFTLLTGCRVGEVRQARWDRVHLTDGAGEVIVAATATKTRRERAVDLSVCPAVVRLLAALRLQAGDAAFVFGGAEPLPDYDASNGRKRLIARYGAPSFTWQSLRATCASFLANAPGIFGGGSAYRESIQLGHSVAVAERNYVGLVKNISTTATTLEVAMRIEDLADQIVAAAGEPRAAQDRCAG